MDKATEIREQLANAIGTVNYYRTIVGGFLHTDGVKAMAELCEAFWLIDAVGSHQRKALRTAELVDFQAWTLKVEDSRAVLTCTDGNESEIITQKIPFTDFPLDEIKFYVTRADQKHWVMMLPSEY